MKKKKKKYKQLFKNFMKKFMKNGFIRKFKNATFKF